jgi:hypothetical protein
MSALRRGSHGMEWTESVGMRAPLTLGPHEDKLPGPFEEHTGFMCL